MTDVRVGTLGKITSGSESGRVVEVIDDAASTGGFLICTYADEDRSPEAFDSWVESFADVESFFRESGWHIDWLDQQQS